MVSSIPTLFAALALPLVPLVQAQLFTVNCQPLSIQRADPIISPGVVSAHTHAVIGGTAFQQTMSTTTAVNAQDTTCDKKLDKSNYWQPLLYHHRSDGQFEAVTFQGSAVYYLNRACNYAPGLTTCPTNFASRSPPAGLRMVVGNPTLRTYNDSSFAQRAVQHVCLRANDSPNFNSLPPMACLRLRAETYFPSCWDGVNLDSADHSSHMAFPAYGDYNTGVCPQSHPVAIYSVFYEFYYDTSPYTDYQNLVWAMGDPTGYGLHGDFINGWNQNALDQAVNTCQGPDGAYAATCSVNPGDGAAVALNPVVPAPSENVGLNGPIPALPGNNPVTGSFVKRRSSKFRM
ncbi:hypothetical protein D0Z07_9069 [Hyphodiscus hymeniophilus]|uniref:DUF1996 domain-containing protein n=1 Tax=Hyphodiscus hymeniophilus TaxID=353542 RepID=A0A9P6SMP1_9HELO|nr:hypothetical protein D0Z07_9069 [Hyphodiscus hymeniophilus]